jgi:hypothetical protein
VFLKPSPVCSDFMASKSRTSFLYFNTHIRPWQLRTLLCIQMLTRVQISKDLSQL